MTALTPLPPAPNRTDPATFSDKADTFVAALPGLVSEINAIPGIDPSNTVITGGSINGTTIGATTAASIRGTTLTATGDVTIPDKIIHAGDTNTSIRFPAADTVTVETNGAERMRIDSAGKILAAAGTNWVGTVSESGQSSVIERGSNANGEFVKYADGTLICRYREGSSVNISENAVLDITWTYPATFASALETGVYLQPERGTVANTTIPAICTGIYRDSTTTTQASLGLTNLNTTSVFRYNLIAIGRWF
jgi:hypothetical protein